MPVVRTSAAHSSSRSLVPPKAIVFCCTGPGSKDSYGFPRLMIEKDTLACLDEMGFSNTKRNLTALPSSGDVRPRSWPRHHKWSAFPVIQSPTYASESYSREAMFPAIKELEAARAIFVDARLLSSNAFAEVLGIWTDREPSQMPEFWSFIGKRFELLDASSMRALRSGSSFPAERFVWNHMFNAIVICSRANFQVAREFNRHREMFWGTSPHFDGHFAAALGHPIAFQILYQLRRELGSVPPPRDLKTTPSSGHDSVAPYESIFFKLAEDGRDWVFTWRGSGKYPAWECVIGRKLEGKVKGFRVPPSTPFILRKLGYIVSALSLNDLVGYKEDGSLCISREGLRFLELIGDHLDDPDMLLRWRHGDGWGSPNMIPSMDRWLNKAFRAIKRRVAALPASPFMEGSTEKWSDLPHIRRVILGRYIHIADKDRSRPDIATAIASIEKLNEGIAWRDTRCGIVRDLMYMTSKSDPIGLWIGIPIGEFNIFTTDQNRVGPLVAEEDVRKQSAALEFDFLRLPLGAADGSMGYWVVDRIHGANEDEVRHHAYDPYLHDRPNEDRPRVKYATWLR